MALPIWMNPFHRPADPAEALRMGRAGAIGVVLAAVGGVVGSAGVWFHREAFNDQLRASMEMSMTMQGRGNPEAEAMAVAMTDWMVAIMPSAMAVSSIIFALIYGILARVQWRRPNRIIPGILLGLFAWGVLSMIAYPGAVPTGALALWSAASWAFNLVSVLLLIVGFRGAGALHAFRTAA